MNKTTTKTDTIDRTAERESTEELEKRAKAEGIDLEHPQGSERFDKVLKKAAKR